MVVTVLAFDTAPIVAQARTDTDIPCDVAATAEYYGGMYGIEPELILAICYTESSYQADVSNGSCVGIMQVNASVHKDILENKGVTDLYDIQQNMCCGCMVLYNLMEEDDDIYSVLMKYNGDSKGLKRYRNTGVASAYSNKVVELCEKLKNGYECY